MKKILFLLAFLIPLLGLSQSNDATLKGYSTLIKKGGYSPAQLGTTLDAIIDSKINIVYGVVASGTNSCLASTLNPNQVTSYATGAFYLVTFSNHNTAAVTINLNGIGVKNVKKLGTLPLAQGDIFDGQTLWLYYDGTNLQIVSGPGAYIPLTGTVATTGDLAINTGINDFNLSGAGGIHSFSNDYFSAVYTYDYNVSASDISLTAPGSFAVSSDNDLSMTIAGNNNFSMSNSQTIFNGGAVSGGRDFILKYKTFTGGNNTNTNDGSATFVWGDNNVNHGIFGAAMVGELGEIASGVGAAFMSGERNYITAYGGVAQGRGVKVSGPYSWVGGWYSPSGQNAKTNTKAPLVSGAGSFGFFETDGSQADGDGVLASSSAVVGGTNPNIPSTAPRSAIIGGYGIKARASDPDQVYVPNFNINTTPANDNALIQLLARDATTGQIKYRDVSSITGGGGSYTDELAQDAVGAMIINGNGTTAAYVDATPSLTWGIGGALTAAATFSGAQAFNIGTTSSRITSIGLHATSGTLISAGSGTTPLSVNMTPSTGGAVLNQMSFGVSGGSTATAGAGHSITYNHFNGSNLLRTLGVHKIYWSDVTSGAGYAAWSQSLLVNDVQTEIFNIDTKLSNRLRLFGPIRLMDIATSSLPAAASHPFSLVWDATTAQVKVSNGTAWSAIGGGGTGVTSITATSPLTGGTITTTGSIGINDAAADGSTKGAAAFGANDFDASSGVLSIDYTNGQKATASIPGFISAADWTTFNNKVPTSRTVSTTSPLSGGGDLSANRTLSIADAAADGTTKGAASFTAADFNDVTALISIDYTNGQKATASVPGFLTAADWTTFNNKGSGTVTNVSGTTNRVTVSTGTTTPVIDISSSYVGQSSITTVGTVTTGATGAGFTINLGTSTVSGALPVANLTAKYILDSASPVTTGGTITLDCNSQIQRMFVGSSTFATGKTMALSNTTNNLVFDFHFEVTNVAATLTLPTGWLMSDANFNSGTHIWTPPATGKYELSSTYDGTNYKIKIAGPFN